MNAALQWLVVGILLLWSLNVALRRWTGPLQQRLAQALAARGWTRIAGWLAPVLSTAACDSGCSDCRGACGSESSTPAATPQPVQWRSPSSSSSSSHGCH